MSEQDVGDEVGQEGKATVAIGFAFVDAAAGRFYVGSLRDDSSRSALLTLLRQVTGISLCVALSPCFLSGSSRSLS